MTIASAKFWMVISYTEKSHIFSFYLNSIGALKHFKKDFPSLIGAPLKLPQSLRTTTIASALKPGVSTTTKQICE